MFFNIVSNSGEKEYGKDNPTYDEVIRFIREQMGIPNAILSYIDDDGKSYYVNCQNDLNEVKKKLAIIKRVNLYINTVTWTCAFCTYEENTDDRCEVCGEGRK